MKEFRYDKIEHNLVLHDFLSPAYTILNDDNTFSVIKCEYNENLKIFYENIQKSIAKYKNSGRIEVNKIDDYTFDVSMLPWINFSSFDLSIGGGYDYLLPIFTIGKYIKDNEKWKIPLSISVNHKVCDGYHIAMFVKNFQNLIGSLSYEELI